MSAIGWRRPHLETGGEGIPQGQTGSAWPPTGCRPWTCLALCLASKCPPAREDKTGQWAQGLLPLTKASSPLDAPQGELPLSAIRINLEERDKQIRSFLIEGGQRPGLGERV